LPPPPPSPPSPAEAQGRSLPPLPPGSKVPVALLLPLTGRDAALGTDLLDAAQLAVFEAGDDLFQLLPRDTAANPDGARAAADQALSEGARLILGPVFAADVRAASPVAASRGVGMIAFSNDRTAARAGTYLIGVTPDEQIRRVVGFAASQGFKRFAALVPEGEFGTRVNEALRRAVAQRGGQVVAVSNYGGDGDIDGVVRRLANFDERHAAVERERQQLAAKDDEASRAALKQLGNAETVGEVGFDALLIPEGGARLAAIAPLLGYYDIDRTKVKVLGLTTWEAPDLGREPSLVGAWYVAPVTTGREGFESRFRAAYGHAPHPLARLAYDATALAALLARNKPGADFSAQALTAPSGYLGASGIFRFLPSGESETGLAVYEVTSTGARVVDPAPDSFMAVTQ
jgi:branched-chain amino acid transport system substrate-binding protein